MDHMVQDNHFQVQEKDPGQPEAIWLDGVPSWKCQSFQKMTSVCLSTLQSLLGPDLVDIVAVANIGTLNVNMPERESRQPDSMLLKCMTQS